MQRVWRMREIADVSQGAGMKDIAPQFVRIAFADINTTASHYRSASGVLNNGASCAVIPTGVVQCVE